MKTNHPAASRNVSIHTQGLQHVNCERSEAISFSPVLDCFVALLLAMTAETLWRATGNCQAKYETILVFVLKDLLLNHDPHPPISEKTE
jgi:hypothetical protein